MKAVLEGNKLRAVLLALGTVAFGGLIGACEDNNDPFEEIGEEIDETIDEID